MLAGRNIIPLWKKAPFVRLLPPLVLGILLEYYVDIGYENLIGGFVACTLVILLYSQLSTPGRFRFRPFGGVIILLILLLGSTVFRINDITRQKNWYGNLLTNAEAIKVEVKSSPQPKAKTVKIIAEVKAVFSGDTAIPARGRIVCYIAKDLETGAAHPGDILIIKNNLQPIRNSGNPGSFDYRQYMAFQRIYHQAFLHKGDFRATGENKLTFPERVIEQSLYYAHATLEKNLKGDQEVALAKALLTGDRSTLDENLVQAYANAGVVHLMAISGLHIGLIYLFLVNILNVVPVIRRNERAKLISVIIGIWFFALMTGGSPSVLRSAVMFSFLALGILQHRKTSTLNFWAAAAFVLLCFNPLLLFHVGFQLSFLAVLGILVAQRPIYNWLFFKNKAVDYFWQLISVTIAAQLFTLPLCLYYFHQFPVLFVIANIVAIPLASMGLWIGLILLLTAWIPGMAAITGALTDWIFRLLNIYINYIGALSFSVWKGFFITKSQALILSAILCLIVYWLLYKSMAAFRLLLISLISFSCLAEYHFLSLKYQRRTIIYNIPRTTVIDFIEGNQYDPIRFSSDSARNWVHPGILEARNYYKATTKMEIARKFVWKGNVIVINKKSFLYLTNPDGFHHIKNRFRVDYLVLSDLWDTKIRDINEIIDAGFYIFTGGNNRYLVEKWKRECEGLHLRFHDIASDGALVLNY